MEEVSLKINNFHVFVNQLFSNLIKAKFYNLNI